MNRKNRGGVRCVLISVAIYLRMTVSRESFYQLGGFKQRPFVQFCVFSVLKSSLRLSVVICETRNSFSGNID